MSARGSVYSWCGCRDPVSGGRLGSRCPQRGRPGHGSWYLSLELPAGLDGHRRRIRRGGYPTRKAAEKALARLRMPEDPEAVLTTGEWLEQRTGPRESTIRGYAAHVRLYLRPCLGRILLADVSAQHAEAMFTAIARQHEAEGRPVTAATLARVRATLRAALNAAIRAGLITANAASRAELRSPRRPRPVIWTAARIAEWQRTGIRPPVAVWTPAQTAQFLNTIRRHRLYAAYHLIALRGLRRGEAAGLRWSDVDLDGATVIITCQLQQYDGRLVLCPPKDCPQRASHRPGPHHRRSAARPQSSPAGRARRARRRLPRERVRVHLPQRRPDGPGPALANLPPPVGRSRAAAGTAARPAAWRGHPRPGRWGGPEGRPGHAGPLEHRAHRRHLHLGASRGRPQGRRGHRHAHYRGRLPRPRHHPAPPARASRPWRRPYIRQPRPPRPPGQPSSTRRPGHQPGEAERDRAGQAA
jgi:integrase